MLQALSDEREHLGVLHHVDDDEQRREEAQQIPVDGSIELVHLVLVADEHDHCEAQGDEAHAQVGDVGGNGGRGDRHDEQQEHAGREPEEPRALDTVVLVEAGNEMERAGPLLLVPQPCDVEDTCSQDQRHDHRDRAEG